MVIVIHQHRAVPGDEGNDIRVHEQPGKSAFDIFFVATISHGPLVPEVEDILDKCMALGAG